MMKQPLNKWSALLGASAIALMSVAGCADRNNNGQPDSPATPPEIGKAMEKAGDKTANAVTAVGNTVVKGTEKMAKAGKNLDDAATMTPKVKTALGQNPTLAGSNINVDTTDKNVTLSGTVKNAAQKNVAGQIAGKNAPGYVVVNKLMVAGGASPMMKTEPAAKKGM